MFWNGCRVISCPIICLLRSRRSSDGIMFFPMLRWWGHSVPSGSENSISLISWDCFASMACLNIGFIFSVLRRIVSSSMANVHTTIRATSFGLGVRMPAVSHAHILCNSDLDGIWDWVSLCLCPRICSLVPLCIKSFVSYGPRFSCVGYPRNTFLRVASLHSYAASL